MNPSYDNSVGNVNSGGMNPGSMVGMPISSGTGDANNSGAGNPVSPGTPISSGTGNPVSSGTGMPISSGTGDIYLGGDGAGKKSKKGLIIGVIVILVIAAVIGIVVVLMNNGMFAKSGQQKEEDLATAYNSFANYVMYGEESTEKVNFYTIGDEMPYFRSLADDEMSEYIKIAQEKYDKLEGAYYEYMGYDENGEQVDNGNSEAVAEEDGEDEDVIETEEDELRVAFESAYGYVGEIGVLESYFIDYAGLEKMTETELVESYINDGAIATQELIDDHYQTSNYAKSSDYLNMFFSIMKEHMRMNLDFIIAADAAGCLSNGNVIQDCYMPNIEELTTFQIQIDEAIKTQNDLYFESMKTMRSLYYLIYGYDGIMNESIDIEDGQNLQSEQESRE